MSTQIPSSSLSFKEALKRFWMMKEDIERERRERRIRSRYFNCVFSQDALTRLSDDEWGSWFRGVLEELWALEVFRDRDFRIREIMSNGVSNLRNAFLTLLYGEEDLSSRYDGFMEKIKYVGTATLTEILCFTKPDEYPIWNRQVRNAINILNLSGDFPRKRDGSLKEHLNGSEYEQVVISLRSLLKRFIDEGLLYNFAELDHFFWMVSSGEIFKIQIPKKPSSRELQDMLKEIGEMLGFSASKEVDSPDGVYRHDVVWRTHPTHRPIKVFEVERSRDRIEHALSALKHANDMWGSQLFLIVRSERDQKRAENLIEPKLRGSFAEIGDKVIVWTYPKVIQIYNTIKQFQEPLRLLSRRI